jgi:hypothetical protein
MWKPSIDYYAVFIKSQSQRLAAGDSTGDWRGGFAVIRVGIWARTAIGDLNGLSISGGARILDQAAEGSRALQKCSQHDGCCLEHLNRDRVAPVLAGLPAVRFWLWPWLLLWLVFLCHVLNKAYGETGSPSIMAACRRVTFAPPLRSIACHPLRLGLLL